MNDEKPIWRSINWIKSFLRPVVHTVDLVHIFSKKGLPIVPDVAPTKGIHFGASASYMLALQNMKSSTVGSAVIFRATCL
jgi:hypothetical protein